jgi:hypothetical protein
MFVPSLTQAYSAFRQNAVAAMPKLRLLALSALAVAIISNLPTAKAMDNTGYQVCCNGCKNQYSGPTLQKCLKQCWEAFAGGSYTF